MSSVATAVFVNLVLALGFASLLSTHVSAQASPVQLEPGKPVDFEMTDDDPAVEGFGRVKVFDCELMPTPDTASLLAYFQATSDTLDLRGRVTDEGGKTNDNDGKSVADGWVWNPCVIVSTAKRARFRVEVAARGQNTTGPVQVVCRLARETAATESVSRAVKQRLSESQAKADGGDRQGALDMIDADLRLLDQTPGSAESSTLDQRRWELAFRKWRLDAAKPVAALQQVWKFRSERYPYKSLQRVRIAKFLGAYLATRAGGKAINEEILAAGRSLEPGHPEILMAKGNLALEKMLGNDDAGAVELYRDILAVQRGLGELHPEVLQTKLALARAYRAMKDYEASKTLMQNVLSALPVDHPDIPAAKLILGENLIEQNDFVAARALLEEVVATCSGTKPRPAVFLRALLDLVILKRTIGDHRGAAALVQELLVAPELEASLLVDTHSARVLAFTFLEYGRNEAAKRLLEASMISEGWRKPDDAVAMQMKQSLAVAKARLGDQVGATALLREILASAESVDVSSRRCVAEARILADVRFELGDRAGAVSIWKAILAAVDRHEHCDPKIMSIRLRLARISAEAGDAEQFELLMGRYLDDCRVALRDATSSLAPRELVAVCSYASTGLQFGLGALQHLLERGELREYQALQDDCFAVAESFRRAAVTGYRLQAATKQADAAVQQRIARVRSDLEAARQGVANALQSDAMSELDFLAMIRERERADAKLQSVLATLTGAPELSVETSVTAIRAQLTPDHAVVAFWLYVPFAEELAPTSGTHYCAWVMTAAGDLQWVPLADSSAVDKAITTWRLAIGDRDAPATQRTGEVLRRLVWDPIAARLGDAKVLHLAGYGDLHTLPWDALPQADGTLLGDRFTIHSHLSLRELIAPPQPGAQRPQHLVGVADVKYEGASSSTNAVASPRESSGGRFGPLPQSGSELDAIVSLHRLAYPDAEQVILRRDQASGDRLKQALPRARFLHLATHGYVHAGEPFDAGPGQAGPRSGWTLPATLQSTIVDMSPFALCGIALAGANDERQGRSGVLVGDDIAGLDLARCELVVLSCCDSAIGVRNTGAAVASLQTALHAAGAGGVVTALWSVRDEATQQLMSHFYRVLWQERRPKHEALWLAKQHIRNQKNEDGSPRYALQDWAAWVLTGDPR